MPQPPELTVRIADQFYLSDVRATADALIFTTRAGPYRPDQWNYARMVATDEIDPLNTPGYRHLGCSRTDNTEYEEYALTVACAPHPELPEMAQRITTLTDAWNRPQNDPDRPDTVIQAFRPILLDGKFHLIGIAWTMGFPPDYDDVEMLQQLEHIDRQLRIMNGLIPPGPGEEHLAPENRNRS